MEAHSASTGSEPKAVGIEAADDETVQNPSEATEDEEAPPLGAAVRAELFDIFAVYEEEALHKPSLADLADRLGNLCAHLGILEAWFGHI